MISIDDFKKVELKVAKVISAERVEGSDKLLKLRVNIGSEESQIIAGIGKKYDPETLVGREIIIIANLEPRQLMGLESQGMLLAANNSDGPIFLTPESEAEPGSRNTLNNGKACLRHRDCRRRFRFVRRDDQESPDQVDRAGIGERRGI